MSYGKQIPYSKDTNIVFEDFSLTYLGNEFYQHPTASISSNTQTFLAKSKDNTETKIKVVSGQLPPQPQNFFISEKGFTLYTFKGPGGTRLEPGHLLIEMNNEIKPAQDEQKIIPLKPKK